MAIAREAPREAIVAARLRRYRRIALWSLLTIVLGAMVLPLGGYLYTSLVSPAYAQSSDASNPRANYWRAVREGVRGTTQVQGQETNVLIQNGGQNWRQLRNGPIANYGGWLMFIVLVLIAVHFALHGPARIEDGRSGRTVPRWSMANRILHWYTAVLFIALAITGLSMLFGRAVLIPLLGYRGFAGWAAFSKDLHNLIGPAFAVGVLLMIVCWFRMHLPEKGDGEWLKKAGGMLSKGTHLPAGRTNAGEKVVFYLGVVIFGIAIVASGFFLDFPNLGYTRDTMQIANVIHDITAIIWIALIFGHIYLGTIGNEGALEGMTHGRVDVNWARQHHNRWYETVKDQAEVESVEPGRGAREQPT